MQVFEVHILGFVSRMLASIKPRITVTEKQMTNNPLFILNCLRNL